MDYKTMFEKTRDEALQYEWDRFTVWAKNRRETFGFCILENCSGCKKSKKHHYCKNCGEINSMFSHECSKDHLCKFCCGHHESKKCPLMKFIFNGYHKELGKCFLMESENVLLEYIALRENIDVKNREYLKTFLPV